MESARTEAYRTRLAEMLAALEAEEALGVEGQQTVMLDQQAVGRLSRMDALQQQAMARAQQARRDALRKRIRAARARIDAGEFGYCEDCGEAIAPARLDLDPTLPRCISCAAG